MTAVELMRLCRNAFEVERVDGEFTLEGGRVSPGFSPGNGEWVAIRGSRWNDGVHKVEDGDLPDTVDETFRGTVWVLRPPMDFLRLCRRIDRYQQRGEPEAERERFGEYEVSGRKSWQQVFAGELAPWRRMFTEVPL